MRKNRFISLLVFLVAGMFAVSSYGQQLQTDKKKQRNFYRKTLGVDSGKAEQVSQVQNNYKLSLNSIVADTALNDQARRVKIQALIEQKNNKLEQLLSPAQQEKIIPTTERMPAKPASN